MSKGEHGLSSLKTDKNSKRSYGVLVNMTSQKGETSSSAADSDCSFNTSSAEGQQILSKRGLVLLNFAWFGVSLTFLVLAIAVVPSQVQFLVGEKSKAKTLAFVAATGSIVTFFTSPLVGYFSDRFRSRWGRRRPFMVIGTFISCLSLIGVAATAPEFAHSARTLAGLASSRSNMTCEEMNDQKPMCGQGIDSSELPPSPTVSVGFFFFSYAMVFFGYSMMTTAYNGLIADKTHHSVRGFSSGVMGLLNLFGNLTGAGLGIVAESMGVGGIYATVATIFFVLVMVTVISTPEMRTDMLQAQPYSLKEAMVGYVKPLEGHDFRWVFITRFLMQMGIGTVLAFLEYWLDDVVALPGCMSPVRAVSILLIPLLIIAAIASVMGGVISDRIKKRKILVISSSILMCIVSGLMAGARAYWMAPILAIFFGLGFGVFMSVDFAMVMDVLPNAEERAKDLAVWHQALVLPQLIATPIGGVIVNHLQHTRIGSEYGCDYGLGYTILFVITAVYFLLSGMLVNKIRLVR